LNGAALKIWCAHPAGPAGTAAGRRGTVVSAAADGIVVAAGDGAVCITELQKAGGKRLSAPVFLAGSALAPGTRLGP
jgi:methionyl-tRNA formyltransferase